MGEVNETSGVCEATETFEAIAATDGKAVFSHLLVQVRTWIRGCVSSHERCKGGARTRNCKTGSFQSARVVNRLHAGDAWAPGTSALDQRATPKTGRPEPSP